MSKKGDNVEILDAATDSYGIADAMRKLADYVEAEDDADISVVCVMQHGKEMRLYALGDDMLIAIDKARGFLDGAIQSIMADKVKH